MWCLLFAIFMSAAGKTSSALAEPSAQTQYEQKFHSEWSHQSEFKDWLVVSQREFQDCDSSSYTTGIHMYYVQNALLTVVIDQG